MRMPLLALALFAMVAACKQTSTASLKDDADAAAPPTPPASEGQTSTDPRKDEAAFKYCSVQAMLQYPNPSSGSICPTDLNDEAVTKFCDGLSECTEQTLIAKCSTLMAGGPTPSGGDGSTAIALRGAEEDELDVKRSIFVEACYSLSQPMLGTGTTQNEGQGLRLNGFAGLSAETIVMNALFGPIGKYFSAAIPEEMKTNFMKIIRESAFGVGMGFGASASAIVGKSLAFEIMTGRSEEFKGETTIGLFCNTSLGLSPEIDVGITGYGIKALGCENHGDYGGDGIGVSLSAGFPAVLGSATGTVGAGLSVNLPKLYEQMKKNGQAAVLTFAKTDTQIIAVAEFLADYIGKIGSAQKDKVIGAFLSTFVGGIFHDAVLQRDALAAKQHKRRAKGSATINDKLTQVTKQANALLKAVADGAEIINDKNLIKLGLVALKEAMDAYAKDKGKVEELKGPIAILEIISESIGCATVQAGLSGSLGVGGKEDAGVGVGAGIGNATLLGEFRPEPFKKLVVDLGAAQRGYDDAMGNLQRLQQRLNEATSVRREAENAQRLVLDCVSAAGNTAVRLNYVPFLSDSDARAAGELAAIPGCLGLATAFAGLDGLSSIYGRVNSAVEAAGEAQNAVNNGARIAQAFLESTNSASRLIADNLGVFMKGLPNAATKCAINTFTVPFASTVLEEAGVDLKIVK